MAHFNPDSKDHRPFRLIEPDKSFKTRVVIPTLQIIAIFVVLRIGMLAFKMPFFQVPLLDPILWKGLEKVEQWAEDMK